MQTTYANLSFSLGELLRPQQLCTFVLANRSKFHQPYVLYLACEQVNSDVVEAHCYVVNIGRTDVLYAVDKGLRSRNVLHQLLLILLGICSRSVHPKLIVIMDDVKCQVVLPCLYVTRYCIILEKRCYTHDICSYLSRMYHLL